MTTEGDVYIRGYRFEDVTNVTTAGPMLTLRQAYELTYAYDLYRRIKKSVSSFDYSTTSSK